MDKTFTCYNRLTFVNSQIHFTLLRGSLRHIQLYSRREIQRGSKPQGYFIYYLHFRETAVCR